MDSFFEQPRTAPEPTSIEKFIFKPSVPEVSMISNTKTSVDNISSENAWKMNYQQLERTNPLISQNYVRAGYKNVQEQFVRKQVRFESPVLHQNLYVNHTPYNDKVNSGTVPDYNELSAMRKQQIKALRSNSPKPFEKIYMANIPDRNLDLSLLDIPKVVSNNVEKEIGELSDKSYKNEEMMTEKPVDDKHIENKENCLPKTYQDFLALQKKMTARKHNESNDSVTDIFNYKKNNKVTENEIPHLPVSTNILQQKTNNFHENRYQEFKYTPSNYQHYMTSSVARQKCNSETQTYPEEHVDSKALQNTKDYAPSNTDLLKIIAQQNEQLLLLQRQVAMLLDRDRNYPKPIEPCGETEKANYDPKKYNSTPQKNHFRQENTITQQAGIFQDNQRKWGMSKFSINLTTSFEMPIRAQHKQNFVNQEPKIQEVTESEFSRKTDTLEPSLHLQEPLDVRELCQSPQPSININMNDYESSDDEEGTSEIGATFYNNLMGQVNNMLKKAKLETEEMTDDENKRSKMLNKVKEATLKHLNSIGIRLKPIDEDFEATENELSKNYTPSEISCSVKQLLMKYLPSDQLKIQQKPVVVQQEPTTGIISPRPEFSMASLEYMRKYNLISSKGNVPDFIQPQKETQKDSNQDNKRILDLTALKMQPKLL